MSYAIMYLWAGVTMAWLSSGLIDEYDDRRKWWENILQVVFWPLTIPVYYAFTAYYEIMNRRALKRKQKAWDDDNQG